METNTKEKTGYSFDSLLSTRDLFQLLNLRKKLEIEKLLSYRNEDTDDALQQELDRNYKTLLKKQIPESYTNMDCISISMLHTNISVYSEREKFIQLQGYALVAKNWVREIAQYIKGKRCLEIMSGQGTLSFALSQQGIDIAATDDYSWGWDQDMLWYPIENIDCVKAIEKYQPDIVVMSWCPYNSNSGYEALMTMRKINPNAEMIVIGEGWGGATANENFFNAIKVQENAYIDRANEKYASWMGIHDRIMLVK